LSISETATFCQVCGARVEAPAVATAEAEPELAAGLDAAAEPESGLTAEPQPSPTTEPGSEPEESGEDPLERRLAEVSSLLDDAAACEDGDPAAAAVLLRESILVCLDAADDPLASERVRRDLLCGFDRLSALLQREGLAEEALEVVDDAALLGLLSGGDHAVAWHRDALKDRREDLRRTFFVDSAQL
jgi:hypothetical protein